MIILKANGLISSGGGGGGENFFLGGGKGPGLWGGGVLG